MLYFFKCDIGKFLTTAPCLERLAETMIDLVELHGPSCVLVLQSPHVHYYRNLATSSSVSTINRWMDWTCRNHYAIPLQELSGLMLEEEEEQPSHSRCEQDDWAARALVEGRRQS